MTDTLTNIPLEGASADMNQSVRTTPFGDGYKQDIPDGLNPIFESWNVTFEGDETEMIALRAFLRSHVGQRFFWTAPLSTQKYFQCTKWQLVHKEALVWNVTATLEERFAP
jgi:phage-related protein